MIIESLHKNIFLPGCGNVDTPILYHFQSYYYYLFIGHSCRRRDSPSPVNSWELMLLRDSVTNWTMRRLSVSSRKLSNLRRKRFVISDNMFGLWPMLIKYLRELRLMFSLLFKIRLLITLKRKIPELHQLQFLKYQRRLEDWNNSFLRWWKSLRRSARKKFYRNWKNLKKRLIKKLSQCSSRGLSKSKSP